MGRLLFIVAVTLAVALPVRKYAIEPIYIASGSMEPTLKTGIHVWNDRVTLRLRPPKRKEIIVLASPIGDDYESVKRVIGLPGETVEMRDKKVYINGEMLYERYVQYLDRDARYPGDNVPPVTIPKDALFILGDNRDVSKDSATWRDPSTGERVHLLPMKNVRGLVRGFY